MAALNARAAARISPSAHAASARTAGTAALRNAVKQRAASWRLSRCNSRHLARVSGSEAAGAAGANSAASSAVAIGAERRELGRRFVLRACLRVFRPLGVKLAFHQGEFEQ